MELLSPHVDNKVCDINCLCGFGVGFARCVKVLKFPSNESDCLSNGGDIKTADHEILAVTR